jgi:tetratricopeptide (TPR) repeat protein
LNKDITPERWSRIKVLFAASLEVPASERSDLLRREAQGDTALIAQVQSLLTAHDEPDELLDRVPDELKAQAFAVPDDKDRLGERIGAYRIVGVLGTGGMGHVFKAVRDDDQYHAEVAIKLMRADVIGPLAEQRFKTERQILAGLDHRNIARMLDGGTTRGGSPYVVMEMVSGEPIDQFSDAHNLKVRERVQLFLQVCAAVGYAHQHLVIHRDLKPNNILVTADGSVKLLDFGIAKLVDVDAANGAAREGTVTQLQIMTLDYASPEQVSGGIVTTVSDVYSLGVVLYRLLTGQSPYGQRVNDAQRVAEILSETTPTRPSLVRAGDRQRTREIDADLDNILLMALRKEPQRRYGSVEQFANDLRNYLAGMPVLARGNSLRYRAAKFVRRRRLEIAAAAVVALSLVGGLWIAVREAQEAERERLVAQRHFDGVRKMANTLLFELHDRIAPLSGSTKARELLVKTSLEYLNTLYEESSGDRTLQQELAVAYKKVGDIQGNELGSNTGDPKAALQSYARSVALLEPLVAADPKNHRAGILLAQSYLHQGRLLLATSGAADAFPVLQKSVVLSESLADAFTDDHVRLIQLSGAYSAIAHVLDYLQRLAEAMAALDKLIALCEAYAQAHPDDPQSYMSLTAAYNNAALVIDNRKPKTEALQRPIALLHKAMAADEKLVAMQPDNARYHWSLAETRYNLADVLCANGEYEKAIELFRQAAAVTRDGDPNDLRGLWTNAMVELGLAKSLIKVGGNDEAAILFASAEKFLQAQTKTGDTLRIEYGLALMGIRRGEMYIALAGKPRLSTAQQLEHWHQARGSLQKGVEILRKVGESIALAGPDKEMLDDGVAGLALAEAAIARIKLPASSSTSY